MKTDNSIAGPEGGLDNLEEIDGIGPGYAKALNEIGVLRFADLARFENSAQLRQALLDHTGVDVPVWKIEKGGWIGQAAALVEMRIANSDQQIPVIESGATDPSIAVVDKTTWSQFAGFSVFFDYMVDENHEKIWRTRAYHDETDDNIQFPGMEAASWSSWILDRANLPSVEQRNDMMEELTTRPGDEAQTITLARGGQNMTFTKAPDSFAVRLKRGIPTSETSLESSLGRPRVPVVHVASDNMDRLGIFRLEMTDQLEETMKELRAAQNAEVVTHVYTVDDITGAGVVPTGAITIQFKPDTEKSKREEILESFGLAIIRDVDFLADGLVVRLTDASTENPLKTAYKLQLMEDVILAEPDLHVPVSFDYAPTDPLYRHQWHLHNSGDKDGLAAGADVKAEEAWNHSKGSREITICIIDDGFDLGHPDFDAPQKIVAPRDFGQNDFDPSPVSPGDNHGTCCAGVALAEENGIGVVGLAPRCAFMPVRFDSISDEALENYFQYAIDNEADVISCSWSAAPAFYSLSATASGIIHKAATQGRNGKGCVILFAAGNDSKPLKGGGYFQGFALHPDVLAVAASNSMDKHASYSNYGPEIAICAPSSGTPGRGIVTTDWRGYGGAPGDYDHNFGGTSSATPLAAGLAALILSVNPQLTATEVKQVMMSTADKIDQAGGTYVNGHSPRYGHGRINSHRAVRRALQLLADAETTSSDEDNASGSEIGVRIYIAKIGLSLLEPTPLIPQQLLEVKTVFDISGAGSQALATDATPYRVVVHVINVENGEVSLVADKEDAFQPQTFRYSIRSQIVLPDVGRYQVRSQVELRLSSGTIIEERIASTTLNVTR